MHTTHSCVLYARSMHTTHLCMHTKVLASSMNRYEPYLHNIHTSTTYEESTHDQPCNVSTQRVSFCGPRARVIMI